MDYLDANDSDNEIFVSCDSYSSLIEESAQQYEKIFEEIQNYEIEDSALDKLEEVFDENLRLKQTNLSMQKHLDELQASIDVQNFKNINESLKKRQSSNYLSIEELKPNCTPDPPPLKSKIPAPPPPPPLHNTPVLPSKYRTLFWQKMDQTESTVFESLHKIEIKQASLNKFLLAKSKVPVFEKPPAVAVANNIIDHKREITVVSALRILALTPDQIVSKLLTCASDLCEDLDKIKAIFRILPSDSEISQLHSSVERGKKLSINENLLYRISQVPNFRALVDCIYYKINFPNVLGELCVCFSNWSNISHKLVNNKRFREFLHLTLAFGNELNGNHPKYGKAKGFVLGFLEELGNIKSSAEDLLLIEVLAEEYCFIHGNPHIFHNSEHSLLKEIANSSFTSLMESYERFYQEYCKLASIELSHECERYIRSFVNARRKDVENLIESMNECKEAIGLCHRYFGEVEKYDGEGRVCFFGVLASFYEKYVESVRKRWVGVSNRDSRRFTMVGDNKRKSKCPRNFK